MPKHHHQSRKEQITHRIHDEEQSKQNEIHYQKNDPINWGNIQKKKELKNEIKTDTKKFS